MYRLVVIRRACNRKQDDLLVSTFFCGSLKECADLLKSLKDFESFSISWRRSYTNGKKA